eukprot:CAMPEP_0171125114 /NCGR_PEP_ID=MMETSP0766_2-20121228/110577_1 /TAXON_ID=439317 /ORGANISM="Gambierdiscus australes, Strain CAWD 149" /LENGTH=47 /DNA_ID= /DNA_START= /DNA_END= /DNA_ORIENTATION=
MYASVRFLRASFSSSEGSNWIHPSLRTSSATTVSSGLRMPSAEPVFA